MKSKIVLSLVMAAAVSLGATALPTNANFNATAASTGNTFTMGTVALAGVYGSGQAINMGQIFTASNMGVDKVATKSASITVKGSLPVVLSTETVTNTAYTVDGKNGPKQISKLTNIAIPNGVVGTYWRHYKMAITASVHRYATNTITTVYSREGKLDSVFDTIQGTAHDGDTSTIGLNELLGLLGTVNPGDVVTIKTETVLNQTAGDGHGKPVTLTQAQINSFQGQTFGADLTIVATEK